MKPAYYAFFDVDGTILKGVSMLNFLKFYFQSKYNDKKWLGLLNFNAYIFKSFFIKYFFRSRESMNRFYYRCYKNASSIELLNLSNKWFETYIQHNEKLYNHNIVRELKMHQEKGADIVFVSGSFEACLAPLAKTLNVKNILCTEMILNKDRYTGRVHVPMIGQEKAKAIANFFRKNAFEQYELCYAYGDHRSDLWMLQMVGNPRVVCGDKKLESWATDRNIPVLN